MMFSSVTSLGFGLGLRAAYYKRLTETPIPKVATWFEGITENYLGRAGSGAGRPLTYLMKIRERFPIVLHGVSLCLGSTDPLRKDYLQQCKELFSRVQPAWVSDHLCWGSFGGHHAHDLLPLPYTQKTIRHVVERLKRVQDFWGRRILIENVSSYAEFDFSEMTEWEFLVEVSERADCGILLDINNIYVSALNHGFPPRTYMHAIPAHRVGQFHLAGHTRKKHFAIDTHDHPVCPEVWELYAEAKELFPGVSTLLERDDRLPSFQELELELENARGIKVTSKSPRQLSSEELSAH